MEISGKIIVVQAMKSGTTKNGGSWQSQEYVIETYDQYPRKVSFVVQNEKINEFGIKLGMDLDVSIDVNAREYNGNWYNTLKAWKVVLRNPQPNASYQSQPPQNQGGKDPF